MLSFSLSFFLPFFFTGKNQKEGSFLYSGIEIFIEILFFLLFFGLTVFVSFFHFVFSSISITISSFVRSFVSFFFFFSDLFSVLLTLSLAGKKEKDLESTKAPIQLFPTYTERDFGAFWGWYGNVTHTE